jgi:hypothetical protein
MNLSNESKLTSSIEVPKSNNNDLEVSNNNDLEVSNDNDLEEEKYNFLLYEYEIVWLRGLKVSGKYDLEEFAKLCKMIVLYEELLFGK